MRSYVDGPLIVVGDDNPTQAMNPEKGPSLFYQGFGFPDPRRLGTAVSPPGLPGYPIESFSGLGLIPTLDIIPTLGTTTQVAAAANTVASTAMTLASTSSTGRWPKIPLVPLGSAWTAANVVTPALALDFGFSTGNTTAASNVIASILAGTIKHFFKGQKLILGEGGGTGIPQVVTVAKTPLLTDTSVTLVENVVASKTATTIGFAHPTGLGAWPYQSGRNDGLGPVVMMHPPSMTARVLSITCNNSSGTGGNFNVVGYDMFGQLMHESIANVPATAVTSYGLKAWKYITSITPDFTDATYTYSVGTGDCFGLPIRSDYFEDMHIAWNAAFLTANTGYLAAVLTAPTATTGDIRGTIQLGTGAGGTGYTTSPNASRRLKVYQHIPTWMQLGSTYLNPEVLFGQTQF